MIQEEWKSIKDFPEYVVSNIGNIKTNNPYIKSNKGKILKQGETRAGYKIVQLSKRGQKKKTKMVSRLVAEAFIPNPNNYPEVNHKDHDKSNNFYLNLEWCTASYNIKYAYYNGRMPYRGGEGCSLSKLKDKDVLEIRKLYKTKEYSQADLAEKFDVGVQAIGRIIRRQRWKHL